MAIPRSLPGKANSLLGHLAVLIVSASVVSIAPAQAPTPVLQYGFGPGDSLKAGGIHDLSGNGHDGTVLNPVDAMLGVTDHLGGTNAIHLQHLGQNTTQLGGIFTDTYTSTLGIQFGPFTVCSWVNRDDFSGLYNRDHMVFGTTDNPTMHLGFREGNVFYGFWNNDSSTPAGFPAGEWHHVAWRYDPCMVTQDILIDGVLAHSRFGAQPYGQDQILIVGAALQYDGNGKSGKFGGALDGAQVFNVALRDDQVLAIAKDMPIPP
jgi:hypothetical protein